MAVGHRRLRTCDLTPRVIPQSRPISRGHWCPKFRYPLSVPNESFGEWECVPHMESARYASVMILFRRLAGLALTAAVASCSPSDSRTDSSIDSPSDPDGDSPLDTSRWDPSLYSHQLDILSIYRDGGTLGDLSVTFPEPGKRLIKIGFSAHGQYTRVDDSTGSVERHDRSFDGVPDFERSLSGADGGFSEVVLEDLDYDGAPDRRTTTVSTDDPDLLQFTREERVAADGGTPAFSIIEQEMFSREAADGPGGCFGGTFPSGTGDTASLPGLPNVRVALDGPGACTNAEAANTLQGLFSTLKEGIGCIESAGNRPIGADLWLKLATATIDIGCGTLEGAWGCTFVGGSLDTQHKILIDREHAREGCIGTTVVHELLHTAGYNHSSKDGRNNEWHACAEYCTRCDSCREGNEQNATRLCAMCTKGTDRIVCGRRDRPGRGENCQEMLGPLACYDEKNAFFAPAQACTKVSFEYCDGTPRGRDPAYCTDICLDGYIVNKPCDRLFFGGFENTCDEFPPFCRG